MFLENMMGVQMIATLRPWQGKPLSPASLGCHVCVPVTSSQVKVKSYSGFLFQRKLSARHGNLFLGSPAVKNGVQSSQNSALCFPLFVSFISPPPPLFEGMEAGLQHYLK